MKRIVKRGPKDQNSHEVNQAIRAYMLQGLNAKEIGEKVGIRSTTIRNRICRYNMRAKQPVDVLSMRTLTRGLSRPIRLWMVQQIEKVSVEDFLRGLIVDAFHEEQQE